MPFHRPATNTSIQLWWFVAGSLATGAVWFFLATQDWIWAALASLVTVLVVILVVLLQKSQENRLHDPIVLHLGENRVTFDELHRSPEFDLIKVNSTAHGLGIGGEYEWISRRYPEAVVEVQTLFEPSFRQTDKEGKSVVREGKFDMLTIAWPDGRKKDIWFDISSFYPHSLEPLAGNLLGRKMREFYGEPVKETPLGAPLEEE